MDKSHNKDELSQLGTEKATKFLQNKLDTEIKGWKTRRDNAQFWVRLAEPFVIILPSLTWISNTMTPFFEKEKSKLRLQMFGAVTAATVIINQLTFFHWRNRYLNNNDTFMQLYEIQEDFNFQSFHGKLSEQNLQKFHNQIQETLKKANTEWKTPKEG